MSSIQVLLIEDNPGDAFLIQNCLGEIKTAQVKVTHVDSLNAAFECLAQIDFDLALLDLSLPDAQGMETLLSFQAKVPNLPIVILTGLDDAVLAYQLVRHGAQDYLLKENINTTWLSSAINHAVARFQGFEERYQKVAYSQQQLKNCVDTCKNELIQMDKQLKTLETLSSTDVLTQIANRYSFQKLFERAWLQGWQYKELLSLILLDIDYFKQFNDSYGHLKGDECLQQVAQSLKKVLKRPRDLVARYGGEEFVAMLPSTSKQGAITVATQMRLGIKALAIRHPNSASSSWVTASFGVASILPTSKAKSSDLIDEADQALYFAKQNGRDRIAYFQPPTFVTQSII